MSVSAIEFGIAPRLRTGPFVDLVDRSLAAKDADARADMEDWERAIDRLVYDLYGLITDESMAVERAPVAPV